MNLYEERLREAHTRIVELFDAHDEHVMVNLDKTLAGTCKVNEHCDDFSDEWLLVIRATFTPENAHEFLADGPADLLDWYCEADTETPRETIAGALRYDAELRIFPEHCIVPQDPATTTTTERNQSDEHAHE